MPTSGELEHRVKEGGSLGGEQVWVVVVGGGVRVIGGFGAGPVCRAWGRAETVLCKSPSTGRGVEAPGAALRAQPLLARWGE